MDLRQTLRRFVRSSPLLRPLRLARFHRIARGPGHEDWATLLGPDLPRFQAARRGAAGSGPRVLIATTMGGHFALNAVDRMLAPTLLPPWAR